MGANYSTVAQFDGDHALRKGDFYNAVRYYTLALERSSAKEQHVARTIIANRSQANLRAGNFHDALNDCNLVLSLLYDTEDEDKILTAQAYLRRACVREVLTLYEAAKEDYIQSQTLHTQLGIPISPSDRKILQLIEQGLAIPPDSQEMSRLKLIRAVEARGLLLSPNYRRTFPHCPRDTAHPSGGDEEEICFEAGTPGSDYLNQPVSVIVEFLTPFLKLDLNGGAPWGVKSLMEEHAIIGDSMVDILTRAVQDIAGLDHDIVHKHESRETCALILVTRRGRLLRLPWDTKVGDIWSGARWPRDEPSPMEVLWSPPIWAHEVDGMEVMHGCMVPIHVVPHDELRNFVRSLQALVREAIHRRKNKFRDAH